MISSTLHRLGLARVTHDGEGQVGPDPSPGRARRGDHRLHVAIIMDGNGRWALGRGRPRHEGHIHGAEAVRRVVQSAPALGIGTLTLYAFSSDNWKRPVHEVAQLMRLFQKHLRTERARCIREGIRMTVIGRRDRLPPGLAHQIEIMESRTRFGGVLHLRLAIDYSSRDSLLRAARMLAKATDQTSEGFRRWIDQVTGAPPGTRDVDLLIRTGGEKRLSDFLLWESAYAELVFTDTLWPDFTGDDLASAVREFSSRERRFGGLPPSDSVTAGRPGLAG